MPRVDVRRVGAADTAGMRGIALETSVRRLETASTSRPPLTAAGVASLTLSRPDLRGTKLAA